MNNKALQIGKRIKTRREELNLTQEDLGKALNMNKSTIQRYESGKVEKIKLPVLQAMAALLHVNPEWLILKTDEATEPFTEPHSQTDTPAPAPADFSELYEKYPNIKPIKKVKIPMLGKIACGEPVFADEEHETYIETDGHITADFCLTCSGDSMEPKILNGDIVFIRKQDIVDDGQIAAVIIEDEATLKRVYYDRPNNILRLIAENPKYSPMVYTGPDLDYIRIVGRAVSLYRVVK